MANYKTGAQRYNDRMDKIFDRARENGAFDEPLVGKILVDMWGYSMTIVNYYKIVSETPRTVTVQQLNEVETSTGFLCGTSVPADTLRKDEKYRVMKPKASGESFKSSLDMGSVHYLSLWNGQPKHFNHCD